ncbi:MAG TPA: NUDIX domain-containing protein, partial [Planococcus sp. (in: firmicutes)]|nr:NUDIX domain-containing protein [Planococcus sp. (in: firmicutes)]
MEKEMIAVCDEEGVAQGIATREEVHKKGLWHDTFHCWIVEMTEGTPYIHLQLRSPEKKDFPDLLDISAAGHILAHETVVDGAREIKEELGIDVKFDELMPLGIFKDQLAVQNFLDNERCHVFLYITNEKLDGAYNFQQEEVAGMFKFDFQEFSDLCSGAAEKIDSKGELATEGKTSPRTMSLADLVPHSPSYLDGVMQAI